MLKFLIFFLFFLFIMIPDIEVVEEINENDFFLRKISLSDAGFFYKNLENETLTRYLSLRALRNLNRSKKLIKNYLRYWNRNIQYNYIIELRENKIIKNTYGSISLWNISWLHKRAEVGVWVVPDFWNQGIGTKSINLIKNIAFLNLKLNRLEAHIAVENQRSLNLFNNCGFVEEGTLKKYLNLNGTFHDAKVLACVNVL